MKTHYMICTRCHQEQKRHSTSRKCSGCGGPLKKDSRRELEEALRSDLRRLLVRIVESNDPTLARLQKAVEEVLRTGKAYT